MRALTVRLAQKDEYTEEHTRRVALRAVQVGEELGLPPGRLRALAIGGLMHDIGKLSVPDSAAEEAGRAERGGVRRDPPAPRMGRAASCRTSAASPPPCAGSSSTTTSGSTAAAIPAASTADELDLDTRILAVCDVYDALISTRVYREAWTHEEALALLLREEAGDHARRGLRRQALERVLGRGARARRPAQPPGALLRPVRHELGLQPQPPKPADHRQLRRLLHAVVHRVDERDLGLVGQLPERRAPSPGPSRAGSWSPRCR